jgi:hypothetical protein
VTAKQAIGALGAAIALALCAAGMPREANALELTNVGVGERQGYVAVSFRMEKVLSNRIKGTLERGMPATVIVSLDVWRHRGGWFDELVENRAIMMRFYRDAWSDEYRLARHLEPEIELPDIGSVERELTRPMRIGVTRVANLSPDERYYAIVHVTLKPLTVQELEEVEKWLSGEARRAGRPGPASIAKLPRYLVGVLANLSGLGDESTSLRTETFTLAGLLAAPGEAGAPR